MNDQDRAIVIGGGIAGVSSALSLADNGYQVYVVEKEPGIGGHAVRYCCKATTQCNSCGVCLAKDKIREAALRPDIHLLTHSEVVGSHKDGDTFEIEVRKSPLFIDESKCVACSLCYRNCPKAGEAINHPYPYPGLFYINKDKCLHFQDEAGCTVCEKSCPTGAIRFDQKEERTSLRASALIVATGFEVYDARQKGHLGYGRFPEVISGLDLEQRLFSGGVEDVFASPPAGKPRVAFIQCVGSRDPHIGQDYCSRVCCKYAVRMAARLKSRLNEAGVTIFYIDLQKTEREFLSLFEQVKKEVRLIKGIPVEIQKAAGAGVSMRYENMDKGCMEEADFDLVVLSVGISPVNQSLAGVLGLRTGADGFFASPDLMDSTLSSKEGIFLAGACQGPKNLVESISHGQEAALRTLAFLKGRKGISHV
ncbi:MAG: FAD-dependent oxidoreductase [Pseudomonadota bacterium]